MPGCSIFGVFRGGKYGRKTHAFKPLNPPWHGGEKDQSPSKNPPLLIILPYHEFWIRGEDWKETDFLKSKNSHRAHPSEGMKHGGIKCSLRNT